MCWMRSVHIGLREFGGFCSSNRVARCESVIGRHHYTRYINQVVVKSPMQKIMGETFQLLKVSRFPRDMLKYFYVLLS